MNNKSHKISDEVVNIANIEPQNKMLVFDSARILWETKSYFVQFITQRWNL